MACFFSRQGVAAGIDLAHFFIKQLFGPKAGTKKNDGEEKNVKREGKMRRNNVWMVVMLL